jgi:hypothetical protein
MQKNVSFPHDLPSLPLRLIFAQPLFEKLLIEFLLLVLRRFLRLEENFFQSSLSFQLSRHLGLEFAAMALLHHLKLCHSVSFYNHQRDQVTGQPVESS